MLGSLKDSFPFLTLLWTESRHPDPDPHFRAPNQIQSMSQRLIGVDVRVFTSIFYLLYQYSALHGRHGTYERVLLIGHGAEGNIRTSLLQYANAVKRIVRYIESSWPPFHLIPALSDDLITNLYQSRYLPACSPSSL
jgi:hypothetical protein